MTDQQSTNEEVKRYVYVEPMGHGSHFVAEIASESIIPGTVQFNILRGDGSIDRTIGMTGSSIFRWTSVSQEHALILAAQLAARQSMYNVSVPQQLLLEAAKENTPPEDREAVDEHDDDSDDADDDDEDDEDEDDDLNPAAEERDRIRAINAARQWLADAA
jgi:hypothetical protein